MSEVQASLGGNLKLVRFLQSYSGRLLPMTFVASQLGLTDCDAQEKISALASQDIVKVDRGNVQLNMKYL